MDPSTGQTPIPEQPDIPSEHAGKWIAWNQEGTEIVASGDTLTECRDAVDLETSPSPRFEKVPPLDVRSIGAVS